MSRIGRLPIQVPAGVTVTIADDNTVTVKGPLGELSQKVNKDIKVEQVGTEIIVSRPSDSKPHRSMHGLYRSLINNMVTGVTKGFEKKLHIEGVGWRIAEWNKNQLTVAVGYSHPVIVDAPAGIEFDVDKSNVNFSVKGIDKQQVGAIAADIRAIRKPEPYHGKGIRYEGEPHNNLPWWADFPFLKSVRATRHPRYRSRTKSNPKLLRPS